MSLRESFEYKKNQKKISDGKDLVVKSCPICGTYPTLEKVSLDRGNGHGYPGRYNYILSCDNCEIFPSVTKDDIYKDKEELMPELINEWNDNVDFVNELINNRDKVTTK